MAGDGPSGAPQLPFLQGLSITLLTITRGVDKPLYDDLQKLWERIETLSTREFLLHPSKCRCLLRSYRLLLHPRFFSDPIVVMSLDRFMDPDALDPDALGPFVRVLVHTLQEGARFLQNCTFLPRWKDLFVRARRQWMINKALPIVLSTEVLDVHLHDFVGCIFTLFRMVQKGSYLHDLVESELRAVEDGLMEIWASADDEGDAQRMQELFTNFKSKELEDICKLVCRRLSESTSEALVNLACTLSVSTSTAQLNLADATVPTYLWMDPPGFDSAMDKIPRILSYDYCDVVLINLMGGRFACKRFRGSTSREVFTNEAVIQASLRHANVMHLLWCTRRVGSYSLVMELMDENLGEVIERRRQAGMDPPFSLLAGIDIMLQIAKGMEYLHDLGIMHRNLNSFNILVRHLRDADNRDHLSVKAADFGSSKVKHDTHLFTTLRVGTGIWRAPEVMDDEDYEKYTNKADVYSFAIVCSEILTGLPADKLLPCPRMSELHRVLK